MYHVGTGALPGIARAVIITGIMPTAIEIPDMKWRMGEDQIGMRLVTFVAVKVDALRQDVSIDPI